MRLMSGVPAPVSGAVASLMSPGRPRLIGGWRTLDSPVGFLKGVLVGPLMRLSWPWLCAAVASVVLLSVRDRAWLKDRYLASLATASLCGPVLIAAFDYHPLRYFFPIAPLLVAFVVEAVASL